MKMLMVWDPKQYVWIDPLDATVLYIICKYRITICVSSVKTQTCNKKHMCLSESMDFY
jgi:hypothetical protein